MKKTVLCILDGVGIIEESHGNAFKSAKKPNFDYLWENYPHCLLDASGLSVGIPDGQMGSSEVGHTNMGAGRVVLQDFVRINKSIEEGEFFEKEELLDAIDNCKKKNSNFHICGLVSDGGVHSHINHLLALLELCKKESFDRVYIHVLLDGRDTEPKVALEFIQVLNNKIKELNTGIIATVGGRYYFMNRDRDWSLTGDGYMAIINGTSKHTATNIVSRINEAYEAGLTDEFIEPTVIQSVPVMENDSLILFNFRSDRMIQPLRMLTDPNFKEFDRKRYLKGLNIVTMTEYEALEYEENVKVVFKPVLLKNSIGEYFSNLGLTQLRVSEAEKRGHVTFYFSGCNDSIYPGEERVIYDKDDVFTYDEKPDMRSKDITKTVIESINSNKFDLIVINYPNGDALGHTGIFDKAVEGVEAVDECLGRIIRETNIDEYNLLITADHGNCEIMFNEDGSAHKAHTTSRVPFILVDKKYKLHDGKLGDIAPTILEVMNIEKPVEMTGNSLIEK